jgi:hypothetical protein
LDLNDVRVVQRDHGLRLAVEAADHLAVGGELDGVLQQVLREVWAA